MTIYKKALGSDFHKLHPRLQERYSLPVGTIFEAIGEMSEIRAKKWLTPLLITLTKRKFLFPETGKHIPFTIVNKSFINQNGAETVHWERVFYFNGKRRYFNASMQLDDNGCTIKDYLGEPSLFYSDLICSVSNGGMRIVSGKQRLCLGKLELPLPHVFKGIVEVMETYDEELGVYLIKVEIRNPLIGKMFSYEGSFRWHGS